MDFGARRPQCCSPQIIPLGQLSWPPSPRRVPVLSAGNEQNQPQAPSTGVKPTINNCKWLRKTFLWQCLDLVPTPPPPHPASPPSPQTTSLQATLLGGNLSLLSKEDQATNIVLLLSKRKSVQLFFQVFFDVPAWRLREFSPSVGWQLSSSSSHYPPAHRAEPKQCETQRGVVRASPKELTHFITPALNNTSHQAGGRENNRKTSIMKGFKQQKNLHLTFAGTPAWTGMGTEARHCPRRSCHLPLLSKDHLSCAFSMVTWLGRFPLVCGV